MILAFKPHPQESVPDPTGSRAVGEPAISVTTVTIQHLHHIHLLIQA
jgi:hypothetical protein